jgi:hypothetical protein
VDSKQAQCVKAAVDVNEFPETLFDNMQNQIFHLLRYDCWPRYCKWQQQQQQSCGKASKTSKSSRRRPNIIDKIIGSVGSRTQSTKTAADQSPRPHVHADTHSAGRVEHSSSNGDADATAVSTARQSDWKNNKQMSMQAEVSV